MTMAKAVVACTVCAAIFATVAAGASAQEWLDNGKEITGPITATGSSVGGMKLSDVKGGLFGEEITVECTGSGKGVVDSTGEDSEASCSAAKTTKGTCPSPKVKSLDIPWDGSFREGLEAELAVGSGGSPGFEVECTGTKDSCTGTVLMGVKNATEGVDMEMTTTDAETEPLSCTRGGSGTGRVVGTVLIKATEGTLSVS